MQKILFSLFLIGTHLLSTAQSWKELGPIDFPTNVSGQINGIGRVTQMVFHPTLAHKRYATSASGGLYYTTDTGHHWVRLGTDALPVSNLASICIDHTNDQIMYLGTGDPNYYSVDYGIYKSLDGGLSWAPANSGIGNRMAVDILMEPTNNQNIVAATNNGLWKTTNAGATWSASLSSGAFTHMQHIPNTNTLIAVTANQVWRSTDWGNTWSQVANITFGAGGSNGMRVMVNNVNPNLVYVASNGNNGEIYKSTDGGASFSSIYASTTQCLVCYDENPVNAGQGNYNFAACCDPLNPDNLYVAAQCLWESTDGGLSWYRKTEWWKELHTDHHQFIFDPYSPTKFWSINDGGVWLREGTNDSLWMPMSDGISATEIYKAASSPIDRRLISIGTQDNGEKYSTAQGWLTNRGGDWTSRVQFDFTSTNYVYYLENGNRRGFGVNTGQVPYNSPFTATNNSRIAFSAKNPNMAVLAKDTLWLSTNIANSTPSWTAVAPFNIPIRDLVISTADSSVVYATHNGKISRIENILIAPIITTFNTPSSNATRGSVATVKNNANILYLSCNSRVWRSSDKGATWSNISYNLPNTSILKLYHNDFSANETIYVCSGNQIFTKSLTDTVWQNITLNLPSISNITDFMMINDSTVASKLRVSYYGRGAWEYKINAQFPPLADFKADNTYICIGDTVRYQDMSFDDSLTYSWTLSGATPSSSTLGNPSVVYNTAGNYTASLTVSNAYGQHVKTVSNYITVVPNSNSVDTSGTGKSVYLDGSAASYVNVGNMKLNTNTLTLMCWIKPDGAQNDWAGLLFARGNGTTSGLSIKDNNEIRIHWDDDYYGSATNLFAIDNEWNHCALVVTPNEARVYVNGKEAIISGAFPIEAFDTDMMLGADMAGSSRRFKGWMDEAVVYNKALTREEIREQMHLIKYPVQTNDNMKGYWQFNTATSSNTTPNSVSCKNQGALNNFTTLVNSDAPFGMGSSERVIVTGGGNIILPLANMHCGFASGGTFPGGEVVFTYLRTHPDVMPGGTSEYASRYWIMDNYGSPSTFTALNSMLFEKAGNILGTASQYELYTRGRNAHGATWGAPKATAGTVVNGPDGNILYTNFINGGIISDGQFVSSGPYYPVGMNIITDSKEVFLYPNPSSGIVELRLLGNEEAYVKISNILGMTMFEQHGTKNADKLNLSVLPSGIYTYEIQVKNQKFIGKLQLMQ